MVVVAVEEELPSRSVDVWRMEVEVVVHHDDASSQVVAACSHLAVEVLLLCHHPHMAMMMTCWVVACRYRTPTITSRLSLPSPDLPSTCRCMGLGGGCA